MVFWHIPFVSNDGYVVGQIDVLQRVTHSLNHPFQKALIAN